MAFSGPSNTRRNDYDAVVVGSGPNGLAAAITLADNGLRVLVIESQRSVGGGMRSAELTLPGFMHDVCSSVHPLGAASPFFRALQLEQHGLQWIHPPAPLVHVLSDDRIVTLERSVAATAQQLGHDEASYRKLLEPFVQHFPSLIEMLLGPLRWPADPLLFARFGLTALPSMRQLALRFREPPAAALLGGIAAHSTIPLDKLVTASFAMVLASAGHAVGWPIARGGSQAICNALVARLEASGGEIVTDWHVRSLNELREFPKARAFVLDVSPKQLVAIAGDALPRSYTSRLQRFRHSPGVFKMDWALSGPIPWLDPRCKRAATVHLGGALADIARSEAAVAQGSVSDAPFVLLVQPSLFDDSRAPVGQHTVWAYCHVPYGSELDMSDRIEAVIAHAAPGFRDLILARSSMGPRELERHNPNYTGGDISGGASDLWQLFFRPLAKLDPYATPARNIFLCSASTPPGPGVHGMCGVWAARSALSRVFGIEVSRNAYAKSG